MAQYFFKKFLRIPEYHRFILLRTTGGSGKRIDL
jgi:hypothetical protein